MINLSQELTDGNYAGKATVGEGALHAAQDPLADAVPDRGLPDPCGGAGEQEHLALGVQELAQLGDDPTVQLAELGGAVADLGAGQRGQVLGADLRGTGDEQALVGHGYLATRRVVVQGPG